ncbi:MAG: MBL fold metallo-hydrolase [Clostridiales bacterium]|jgi:glyoxylase-like metal-dependent hydrolase (beta-lactamase superfamily II)|nr:MBL fold metallo-hydrolase [Clostridiales bacterium]
MKDRRNLKVKLIIIGCFVAVAIIMFMQPLKSLLAMTSMRTLPTQEVITDIFSIKNAYVNLYLLKSGDKYIAFDAGVNLELTKETLDDLSIDTNDIIALFLTHTDYDHVAAVPLFSSADIYMAQSNKVFLENDSFRSQKFIEMEREYNTLEDMESIDIFNHQIQCIFTPGHTDGSASYIVDSKYLFTGDTIRLKRNRAVLFYSAFNLDSEEQKQSIAKLAKLKGIDAVFTMHTGYTNDFDFAFSNWFD